MLCIVFVLLLHLSAACWPWERAHNVACHRSLLHYVCLLYYNSLLRAVTSFQANHRRFNKQLNMGGSNTPGRLGRRRIRWNRYHVCAPGGALLFSVCVCVCVCVCQRALNAYTIQLVWKALKKKKNCDISMPWSWQVKNGQPGFTIESGCQRQRMQQQERIFFFFTSYNRERSGSKRQRSSNSSGSRGLMDEGGREMK
jgi:hypothetical protein